MPLQVIGAGFGRTGTLSLKIALEQLGFGPCYHMIEVLKTPGAAEHWAAAAKGAKMDWEQVFAGYKSSVDWPGADYWRELVALMPDAKVILSTRDPEAWFRSTQDTIFNPNTNALARSSTAIGETMRAIGARNFNNRIDDHDTLVAAFKAHEAAVRREVPAERLLVFNVAEGWGPLCRFLDVAVPDAPFPRTNSTDEFREHAKEMMKGR